MNPNPDPWNDYRHRRRRLRLSFLAGLAAFAGSFPVARAMQSERPLFVGLALFLGAIVSGFAPLEDFACPNCGEPFIHHGWRRNLFTRTCMNCRHPRWAAPVRPEAGPADEARRTQDIQNARNARNARNAPEARSIQSARSADPTRQP
jgi:hypothetical protein